MKEVYVGAVQNLVVCPRRHGGAAGLWQCEAGKASQPPLATQDPTARNARSVQIDHVKVCIGLKPLATINRHSVRGSVYGARLEERWQAHRRRVHVVENPHTAQRDQSSDDHCCKPLIPSSFQLVGDEPVIGIDKRRTAVAPEQPRTSLLAVHSRSVDASPNARDRWPRLQKALPRDAERLNPIDDLASDDTIDLDAAECDAARARHRREHHGRRSAVLDHPCCCKRRSA
jgi:hypothetical protein